MLHILKLRWHLEFHIMCCSSAYETKQKIYLPHICMMHTPLIFWHKSMQNTNRSPASLHFTEYAFSYGFPLSHKHRCSINYNVRSDEACFSVSYENNYFGFLQWKLLNLLIIFARICNFNHLLQLLCKSDQSASC